MDIFDIDSALDRLEENLLERSINTEPKSQQQKIDKAKQQQNKDFEEENGNESLSDGAGASESLNDNKISVDLQSEVVDESPAETTKEDITKSNVLDNAVTQTFSVTTFSDNFSNSASSSTDSDSSDSSDSSEGHLQRDSEFTSQVTTTIDHDDSSKRLISDESSNPQEEETADDLPVTADLTLTKTVELTENEPDPEPEVEAPKAEPEQLTFNVDSRPEIPQAVVAELVKHIEEPMVMEMSLNNFESTMDDISDAELESLEQELEDLVAVVEQSNEKPMPGTEVAVRVSEDLTENKTEVVEAPAQVIEIQPEASCSTEKIEAEVQPVETPVQEQVETSMVISQPEEPSEILEVSAMSVQESEQRESSVSEAQEAVEPPAAAAEAVAISDPDPALSTSSTDESTSIQNLPSQSNEDFSINESNSSLTGSLTSAPDLGRVPPYWIPDEMTNQCMQCDTKFSLIKRRHHCRACGLLLCSSCCNQKFHLAYLGAEGRICGSCHETLVRQQQQQQNQPRNPNPANPMEYCSTLPPQQQVNPGSTQPPTVMVPGVLKRAGPRSSERKSVIFSDGIRPGTDLDELSDAARVPSGGSTRSGPEKPPKLNMPPLNKETSSFIPNEENALPPVLVRESSFDYVDNNLALLQRLRQEELKFAVNQNFFVTVKVVTLTCCTNKTVINFATSGLLAARQDELLILLELNDDMTRLPKEVFLHLNEIYGRADKSNLVIKEYGYSQASSNNFLGAFGGFLYIRPSFQCQQSLALPESPYLIGLLVHKWEIPWMRLFPLRLILRLGALYRYYPTPILSNVNREPVYAEIGNTIINILADFRNFSYTVDVVKGLNIHMEERKTTMMIPKNRYNQIMKVLNNSSDHILAFGADFSKHVDGHLVCIQNIDSESSEPLMYSTQAIDIQGKERTKTGASFIILNGALKSSSGYKAKCSIVEDGLMIQIEATKMLSIREALKNMKDVEIQCGPIDTSLNEAEETVAIEWVADDVAFNLGVVSPIDNQSLEGKESIRTKIDFFGNTKMLRWAEVFLLESSDDLGGFDDDRLKFSKNAADAIANASGTALLPLLDLMAGSKMKKIGIRVTLGENITYLAGSNGAAFSPIFMNALDNELIGVIHRQASNMGRSDANLTLELIFYILNVEPQNYYNK